MTLLVLGLLTAPSLAAERSRVALVRASGDDALLAEATTRLQAELGALGFEVVLVDPTEGGDARASVEAAHLTPPPIATLALSHEGSSAAADVWVADGLTAKTSVRRIDVRDVSQDRAPSVLAVRAVELLRASLLEAARPPHEKQGEEASGGKPPAVPPPPLPRDVERFVDAGGDDGGAASRWPPTKTGIRAELGAALLTSLSGSSPAFGPMLRVGYGSDRLSGRISVVAPAFGAGVDAPAGSASIRQELAVFELVTTLPPSSRFLAVLSAGAGVHHARIDGSASPPFSPDSGDSWGFLGVAGAGVGLRLGASSGLLLDVHALFRTPLLAVQVGDVTFESRTPELATTAGFWEAF
jgi:hypothetical protein